MGCLLCEGDINFKKFLKHCSSCDNIICHICSKKVEEFCPFCRGDYHEIPNINFEEQIKNTKYKDILLNKLGIYLVQEEKYEDASEYFVKSSLEIAEDNVIFLYKLGLLESPIPDRKVDFFNHYLRMDSICYLENANKKWLEILSDYGYHHAQYKLAVYNDEYELTLIYKAIENGSTKACIFLYDINHDNIYWLKKAAEMKDPNAMIKLYHNSDDIDYLYQALVLGSGNAARYLGDNFLENGSLVKCYQFYEKAVTLGCDYSGDYLITIKEILLEPIEKFEDKIDPIITESEEEVILTGGDYTPLSPIAPLDYTPLSPIAPLDYSFNI